jgi:hypothetical protein
MRHISSQVNRREPLVQVAPKHANSSRGVHAQRATVRAGGGPEPARHHTAPGTGDACAYEGGDVTWRACEMDPGRLPPRLSSLRRGTTPATVYSYVSSSSWRCDRISRSSSDSAAVERTTERTDEVALRPERSRLGRHPGSIQGSLRSGPSVACCCRRFVGPASPWRPTCYIPAESSLPASCSHLVRRC